MVIRGEQMKLFQAESKTRFITQLQAHLRSRYPGVSILTAKGPVPLIELADAALETMVRSGVARAKTYGLTWQSSLAGFTVLMFLYGPEFDRNPLVQRELTDPTVPDEARVDHLCKVIPDTAWDDIRGARQPDGWRRACAEAGFRPS
jgi:hypothetical protein